MNGLAAVLSLAMASMLPGASPRLVWPTPNDAFQQGAPMEEFLQPTLSGRLESALFGCTRNDGTRFHEGLDLKPVLRRRRGEPTDPIFVVLPGRVIYVNERAGHSSYGRYVVVEHEGRGLTFYTLYAHLARVDLGIEPGRLLRAGERLGVMGRSSATYRMPQHQAHLHFEIVLRLSDDFQAWYDAQPFGSPNHHGNYNGMNLVGVDPLAFMRYARAHPDDPGGFFGTRQVAFVVRMPAAPGVTFPRRHPRLVQGGAARAWGWEIGFDAYGVPVRWRALAAEEAPPNRRIQDVITELLAPSCASYVQECEEGWVSRKPLRDRLDLLGF